MNELNFTIEKPETFSGKFIKGKARPFVVKKGWAFSPKSNFEKLLKHYAIQNTPENWDKQGVFGVEIACYFEFLKKDTKEYCKENGGGWYQKKPDIDNIAKAVLDCLNGVAWIDDNSVASLKIDKFYQNFKDEKELINIKIKRLTISDKV